MSSKVFEVILRPDPQLRSLVLWSGVGLITVGIVLISRLELTLPVRAAVMVLWLFDGARECSRFLRYGRTISKIVLDTDGNVRVTDPHGRHDTATLLTGSLVISRLAWLRLQTGNGRQHVELFTRRRCGKRVWHRLQLLWQQAREAFRHPPGP